MCLNKFLTLRFILLPQHGPSWIDGKRNTSWHPVVEISVGLALLSMSFCCHRTILLLIALYINAYTERSNWCIIWSYTIFKMLMWCLECIDFKHSAWFWQYQGFRSFSMGLVTCAVELCHLTNFQVWSKAPQRHFHSDGRTIHSLIRWLIRWQNCKVETETSQIQRTVATKRTKSSTSERSNALTQRCQT